MITNKGTQSCLGQLEKVILEKEFIWKRGRSALHLLAPPILPYDHKFWLDTFNFNDDCRLALFYWCFLSGNSVSYIVQL